MALSLGLGLGLTPSKGGGFDFANWRAQQLDGIWLDYTDPDWLRQEPNGPTAVAATNDVIGLAMSRRLIGQQGTLAAYLAGQTELANPAGGTNRSTGTGTASQSGGSITLTGTNSSNGGAYDFPISTVAGRLYRVDFTIAGAAGWCGLWQNAGFAAVISGTAASRAPGSHTIFFTAGGSTTFFGAQTVTTGGTTTLSGFTIKEVSRTAATQATVNARPKFDGDAGAIHDALHDRNRSTYTAKAGPILALASVTVAASLPGTQVIVGMNGATDTAGRVRLGVTGPGLLRASVGNSDLDGVTDLRGQTLPVGLAAADGVVRIFAGSEQVGETTYVGSPDTTIPFTFGGRNNNGADASYWGGRIRRAGVLQTPELVDAALWARIAAAPGFHFN